MFRCVTSYLITFSCTMSCLLSVSLATHAAEGMWVPQQLPALADELKKAGLEIDAQQLANLNSQPLGAVVSLGGCSASFVSPLGLVVTNHHCAFGAIQLNSTPEKNLIKNGFNAATLADEISAGPNARIYVLDRIDDVTKRVLADVTPTMDGLARQLAIENAIKKIVAAGESEPGIHCRVYSYFGGLEYLLYTQLEIKDVRLVYAPPNSVGCFGGDIDNWMWPRHTGDFSLIRAYVGKDGKPAEFAADNVPYKPKHWLRIANKALETGDYVMVAGYPGRTNRYALASEFDHTANWSYANTVKHYTNLSALVAKASKDNRDIGLKYANSVRGWENTLKNFSGQLAGFARTHATEIKHSDEQAVIAWLKSQGETGTAALAAYENMVQLNARSQATAERDSIVGNLQHGGLLGIAAMLYRLSLEKIKPDAERRPGYQERDWARIKGRLDELEKRFHPDMDQEILLYWLRQYRVLPESQRIAALDKWLGGLDEENILRKITALYAGTQLGNLEKRLELFSATPDKFESSSDSMINLAVALMPTMMAREDENRAEDGEMSKYRPVYMAAVKAYRHSLGQEVYPDANSSLRVTFGQVAGYEPQDGLLAQPFTTAEGVAAKATKEEPFDAPQELLNAIREKRYGRYKDKKLGTLPVNFLATLDTTGGNSGSPVMNGKGELVGLLFDGVWDSVSSNWIYDRKATRSICLDIRYMLWYMDVIDAAPRLFAEMGVETK